MSRSAHLGDGPASSLLDPAFLARLERLKLVSRQLVRGTQSGQRRSRMLGSSLEFADYRSYYPGDDIRQVDWAAYARLGKWFLKTFLDERETEVHLYLDTSLSMGWRTPLKSRLAVQLMAALGYLALHHGDRVSAFSFRERVEQRLNSVQGRTGMFRLLRFFDALTFEGKGDLNRALSEPGAVPKRPGLSIVLSDGFSPSGYEQGLADLQGAGQQVSFIHLTAQEERDPSYTGDIRFLDCETGREKQVSLSPPVLRAYRETYRRFSAHVQEWCFRRGIVYVAVSAEDPLETVLFSLLRRSGLVRA
ncbi:DUF58 domain-containing protein [Lihuaxuella thermophila]|uniref:DUF58 domain-containing protein n=1 Tax=Lihuaxuella thermophila TaxID=1173111 RepID=A0A1H8HG10_9BACL|nr:DUF58 domain-containing protein [Lihuaxuella thermophila]SEN54914.1 Protein of unknown function DUF58 [Lihuaxuella thermophila]